MNEKMNDPHYEKSGRALPTTPEDIVAYLQMFVTQLNPRTLSRRLTALKHWHTYQGFDDPTLHPVVRKTLKGITNTHGKPKEKALPLLPEQLIQMVHRSPVIILMGSKNSN